MYDIQFKATTRNLDFLLVLGFSHRGISIKFIS